MWYNTLRRMGSRIPKRARKFEITWWRLVKLMCGLFIIIAPFAAHAEEEASGGSGSDPPLVAAAPQAQGAAAAHAEEIEEIGSAPASAAPPASSKVIVRDTELGEALTIKADEYFTSSGPKALPTTSALAADTDWPQQTTIECMVKVFREPGQTTVEFLKNTCTPVGATRWQWNGIAVLAPFVRPTFDASSTEVFVVAPVLHSKDNNHVYTTQQVDVVLTPPAPGQPLVWQVEAEMRFRHLAATPAPAPPASPPAGRTTSP